MEIVFCIFLTIIAYLLGSIPSAVWIGKRFYNIDVREHGSKNAGTTNTLRLLGNKAGLIVFLMDTLKGALAVWLIHLTSWDWGSDAYVLWEIIFTIAALLGHIFPVFAGFKGGKGVATLCGAVAAIHPYALLLSAAVFFTSLAITHYVSLSSMLAGITFPVWVFLLLRVQAEPITMKIFSCAIPVMLIITHRKNIRRLLKGEESKISFKKKTPPSPNS